MRLKKDELAYKANEQQQAAAKTSEGESWWHGFLGFVDCIIYATLHSLPKGVSAITISVTVIASIVSAYIGYALLLKEDKKFSQGSPWSALGGSVSVAFGTSLVTSVCTTSIVLTVISLVAAIVFELLLLGWTRL